MPEETTPMETAVILRQGYLALAGHLGALIMAAVWSYSATALPSLRKDESFEITQTDEAWTASITFLAGAAGSFVFGYISQTFGLKRSLQVASILLIISWSMVAAAQNVTMLLVGRFVSGFAVSNINVSTNLVAELCDKRIRGRLNLGFDLLFCVGVEFIYVIGTFFEWRIQAGSCAALSVVWFVLLLTIPESPGHTLKSHKRDIRAAKKALAWSYKCVETDDVVQRELQALTAGLHQAEDKTSNLDVKDYIIMTLNEWKGFLRFSVWKPIFIAIALQIFLQASGVVPIVCYAVDVFTETAGDTKYEHLYMIIFGFFNLAATFAASFVVDKLGRRKLMIISELCLTTTLVTLGTFLFLRDSKGVASLQSWEWFPTVCLVIYIIGYSFGVGPLPWVIMGEILEPSAKGFSNGVIGLVLRVVGFLVMFYFNRAIDAFGQWWVYWFFAIVCASGFFFSLFFLPETKGLDLNHIQRLIQKRWIHLGSRPVPPAHEESGQCEEMQQMNKPVENGKHERNHD